jgi:hypothetical protein
MIPTTGVLQGLEQVLRDMIRSAVAESLADQRTTPQTAASPWMDVAAVAEYTRMTPEAARAAVKRGQLKSYRSSTGRIRCRVEDVDAFLMGES